ncbi:MAG TPA: hypothetical protein VN285_09925 [Candidatus Deferrimicrobium sp.]|nr:hypothetical protein [Candidatus Deferrimicrobium sp.]
MHKLTATGAAFACAILLSACDQAEKTVVLRYKFEKGVRLAYEQTSRRTSRLTQTDASAKETSATFAADVEHVVLRVLPDSSAEIQEVSSWTEQRELTEDSTGRAPLEKRRTLVLLVQPDGKVRDVQSLGEPEGAGLRYIKNYYEQGIPVFPARSLAAGDSWTQTTKVVLPEEEMEASMTYRLRGLAREAGYDCAVIECDGEMIIPLEPDTKDSVERSGLDRIRSKGTLHFAYTEGIVVMQTDKWIIDRERRKTYAGKTEQYHETVELDIDFMLKERGKSQETSL